MSRFIRWATVLGASLFGGTAALAQDYLLASNAQVVDVAAGTMQPRQVTLIRDGVYAEVGEGLAAGEDAEILYAGSVCAVPRLRDAPVRVVSGPTEPDAAVDMYLLSGVTGICEMGANLPLEEQRRIAAEVEEGTRRGPRTILSGTWVEAPPGARSSLYLAAAAEKARARLRRRAGQR